VSVRLRRAWAWLVAAVLTMTLAGLLFGWYSLTQPTWSYSRPGVGQANAQADAQANSENLKRHVYTLATQFPGRTFDNRTRLEGAANYIEAEWVKLGLTVTSQRFVAQGRPYRNLVVNLGPDTPDITVVGAHYDVAGQQPGADDNASGVAGLIELTRLLQTVPLKQRVQLVAYTNEEPPFFRTPHMGSAVHARSLKAEGKRAALMLSLECIGYFSDAPGSQSHPVRLLEAAYPTVGNFISLVGFYEDGAVSRRVKAAMQSTTDLPVYSINAPSFIVGVDFSDHLNYASEGFVGMMVTDTAFYRNKAYHTPQDTPDRLDYGRMAKVVDAVLSAVR
jgi:hypothetical protein